MSENNQQNPIFTTERINNFAGLYNILKNINCSTNKLVIGSKGLTLNKNKKRSQPIVDYQSIDDNNGSLNQAFDILFEETLRQIGGLDAL